MKSVIHVQILDEHVYISLCSNTFDKGISPFLSIEKTTRQGEGKIWRSNELYSLKCQPGAPSEWFG